MGNKAWVEYQPLGRVLIRSLRRARADELVEPAVPQAIDQAVGTNEKAVAGAVAGFLAGVFLAMVYNLAVRWTGGIEIVIDDKS